MIKLEDIVKEIKSRDKKRQLSESLLDSFLTLLGTVGAAFIVKFVGPMLVQYVSNAVGNAISSIKGIVKPTNIQKFEKELDNDKQFSKEALQLISHRGGLEKIKNWDAFAKAVIKLPAFINLFEKFCEENNIPKNSKDILLIRIEYAMKDTMKNYGADVVRFIQKKHPELKDKS